MRMIEKRLSRWSKNSSTMERWYREWAIETIWIRGTQKQVTYRNDRAKYTICMLRLTKWRWIVESQMIHIHWMGRMRVRQYNHLNAIAMDFVFVISHFTASVVLTFVFVALYRFKSDSHWAPISWLPEQWERIGIQTIRCCEWCSNVPMCGWTIERDSLITISAPRKIGCC